MASDSQSSAALLAATQLAISRVSCTQSLVSVVPMTHMYLFACLDAGAIIPLDNSVVSLKSKAIPEWKDIFGSDDNSNSPATSGEHSGI